MSNILFYIPDLIKEWGGVYHYSYNLLTVLANSKHLIFIDLNSPDEHFLKLIAQNENLILIEKVKEKPDSRLECYTRTAIKKGNIILEKLKSKYKIYFYKTERYLDEIIKNHCIEIIHCPYQSLGTTSYKIPQISTMHDVQELHFPQFFSSEERATRANQYKWVIDNSNAIIVSFNHIKNDIVSFFNKQESLIHVCFPNMKNAWFEKYLNLQEFQLDSYNLPINFLFYPSQTWEHKNHIRLIEAIYFLKQEKNIIVNLVCSGNKTNHFKIIENKIKELELQNQITFLGMVPEIDLYKLYKKATAVIVPTLYEAGSYPLIESILLGIPVVCSNTTSLPETMGNNEFVFNPYNIEDISLKIDLILNNKDYINNSLTNSTIQSKKIQNSNMLEKLNLIYNQL